MDNPKHNPIAEEWKKRYSEQPPEIKEKLDTLDRMNPNEYQLKVIKRKKPELKEGDVFVLSPRENVYFYGKVLKVNINQIEGDSFIHGKNVIFIFQNKTTKTTIDDYKPDYNKLLILPAIVDVSYWTKGYFFNVGNEKISNYEETLNYGFLNISFKSNWYCKEDGTRLKEQPQITGIYGISTIIGIASKIEKELIIDPKLLEFE